MTSDHTLRLKASADRLAYVISNQARSLALFPIERMNEDAVTYDLLIATAHAVLLQLANHEPSTTHTLVAQFADELRLLVEEQHTT